MRSPTLQRCGLAILILFPGCGVTAFWCAKPSASPARQGRATGGKRALNGTAEQRESEAPLAESTSAPSR